MGFWGQNSIRGQALFQPLVAEGLFPAAASSKEAVASVVILRKE